MSCFQTVNPFSGEKIAEYPIFSRKKILSLLESSAVAFQSWKKSSFEQRAALLQAAGRLLRERVENYALLITDEMGKPLKEARAEVNKCAALCDYYAQQAELMLKAENISTEAVRSYVRYEPIGAVFAVMPWNFPFWQVFRFAAPALMAGNTALLKHAPNSSGAATAIEQLFADAGYPENVFRTLIADTGDVPYIIAHPVVQAVTLTGSERAGASVAEAAGLRLKKTVLELGGSDAFIVCEDADFEKAVRTAVQSRLLNGGQSCISAKRFFVHENIYEKFRTALLAAVSKLKQGNPREEDTDLGPMARPDLADLIEKQVEKSLQAGATLVSGGKRNQNFFEPTVLENIPLTSPAFREELFGPVFTLFSFSTDEQAIHLANLSEYGLGAAVWSENRERAEKMAAEIAAGCVFINSLVRSDQRVPFGGIKKSGYGRELSLNGIREFVNVKTVWVD